MAQVYSKLLCRGAAFTGGPVTLYTVPAGKLTTVKSISIVFGNITGSGLDAWVQDDVLAKLARYTWAATLSDPTNYGGTALFWGMWALEAGTSLALQTVAGTCDFYVSGYELTLP